MNRAMLKVGLAAFVVSALCHVGCGQLAYQYMNDPPRDLWQRPAAVVERVAIEPGSRVADLGAGGGYFTAHLAQAVGPDGTVYAVDVDPTALGILMRHVEFRGLRNVVPILASADDARLPQKVDLVFSSDTYHHLVC